MLSKGLGRCPSHQAVESAGALSLFLCDLCYTGRLAPSRTAPLLLLEDKLRLCHVNTCLHWPRLYVWKLAIAAFSGLITLPAGTCDHSLAVVITGTAHSCRYLPDGVSSGAFLGLPSKQPQCFLSWAPVNFSLAPIHASFCPLSFPSGHFCSPLFISIHILALYDHLLKQFQWVPSSLHKSV